MSRVVEIRSYTLKPGTLAAFDRLVRERSLPMLERWKVDVVGYGASLHDDRSCFLIRAYGSLEERRASQDAFYGSQEWKDGPREALLSMIEGYTTVVLGMDEETVEALRSTLRTGGSSR
ncbi:MAG TPA: NIPSNAP family protein [Candidatus Eisenbacteria bacterium]|nr:NIPSNAP family protein [Candidatus Eisenbacteria bacterium]